MEKEGKRLLSFSDVSGLLHEMGHILHSMVDKSPYIATWMFAVSNDFVEIPSQFMECFWEEDMFVKRFLQHYKTNKTLPAKQRKLITQKSTAFLAREFAGTYDLVMMDRELHGKNFKKHTRNIETLRMLGGKRFSRAQKEIKLTPHPKQMFLARFGHIMSGYQSKFYSYLASYAYMREIWQHFKNKKINKKSGLEYRDKVLSIAAMRDEKDILESYLGRQATFEKFKYFLNSLE
jgi:Zn-dependent oligopeptidase